MRAVTVSTNYTYHLDGEYLRFFVGKIEGVPLVEIYSGNNLIYYKPLNAEESKMSDIELIQMTVKSMSKARNRWYDNKICQWLVENFETMIYKERTTIYEFQINSRVQRVFVTEDYKNHARVHLLNDETRDKLSIDFDVQEGENILQACANYVGVLNIIIKAFKENESEINQPTLLKNMFTEE